MKPCIRTANLNDCACIQILIRQSAQTLQAPYYDKQAIQAALELVRGIDELIRLNCFLVAEHEQQIIGCGGWLIDTAMPHQAEIRGFFVAPDFARQGIATRLLVSCEHECISRGVEILHLTATLAGEAFYKKCGFTESSRLNQRLSNGEQFELIEMKKSFTRLNFDQQTLQTNHIIRCY